MIANKLFIFGGRYDTAMSAADIEQKVQLMCDRFYGLDVVKFGCSILSDNEVELSWRPNQEYAIAGDFISDYDMGMTTSLPLECFRPRPLGEPIVAPLAPMGRNFYAPIAVFSKLYKRLLQDINGDAKKIRIVAGGSQLVLKIRF